MSSERRCVAGRWCIGIVAGLLLPLCFCGCPAVSPSEETPGEEVPCNDNDPCTTDMDIEGTCQNVPIDCDDMDPCTLDACVAGACAYEHTSGCCSADADCNDELYCNGPESCVDSQCETGSNPCAADEQCDEGADECVECLASAHCDDGQYCNGRETCLDGQCQAAANACPADKECDEAADECVACLTNERCDDGVYCNGMETCVNRACLPVLRGLSARNKARSA